MSKGKMYRATQTALLVIAMTVQSAPAAWAQLEDVDPALHAAVEALITTDPAIVNDPELAEICRQVAEATVTDPVERAAVTNEVAQLHREGVDISTVVPVEVRDAAREVFSRLHGEMQAQLETLRATDPTAARELELRIQEGERCMLAFETGEQYVPSAEMLEHAETMFKEWETYALEQGAPPELREMARAQFEFWSAGGVEVLAAMGPGHEFGPGHEMPTIEQMQTMGMTQEQIQMAQEYMQHGGPYEAFGPGPGAFEAFGHMGFEAYMPAFEMYAPGTFEAYASMGTFEHMMTESTYTSTENLNYDNVQQQHFDQVQPPPGSEVLVASHDHNGDGINDEFHYDVNADGIADHAHPTPH